MEGVVAICNHKGNLKRAFQLPFVQKIGLAYLIGWSLITAYVFMSSEDVPLYIGLLPLIIPFAQVATFSSYHTNPTKQKCGLAFGSIMAVSVALFYMRVPANGYSMFLLVFFVASALSAVFHAFYGYGSESALTVSES